MEQATAPMQPAIYRIPDPYEHQAETTDFVVDNPQCFVFNDPGTGKTRSILDAVTVHRAEGGGKTMVLCPKAIIEPSWLDDGRKFTPKLRMVGAYARNRSKVFNLEADVYITNHDAAKWLAAQDPSFFDDFDFLVIDESTAYKNRTAQRSKAIAKITKHFDRVVIMTGTPMPNGVLDVWHQAYLVDGGARLGKNFWAYRSKVCAPEQVGPRPEMIKWVDLPGAQDAVADLLSDVTIRYQFEDCIDIPSNSTNVVQFALPTKLRTAYEELQKESLLELENGTVTAVNAAVLLMKLLQVASGAVYDADGTYHTVDTSRYELIAELCDQRQHTVVAFLWGHQKQELIRALEAKKLSYVVVDGETKEKQLPGIIRDYQEGKYRVLLAHPQSASHGLTLTKGTTTIWASPTYNAERFLQFNRRIYRAGQTHKTETLLVEAIDTLDKKVYDRLMGKLDKQESLLELLKSLKEAANGLDNQD